MNVNFVTKVIEYTPTECKSTSITMQGVFSLSPLYTTQPVTIDFQAGVECCYADNGANLLQLTGPTVIPARYAGFNYKLSSFLSE